MASDVKTKHPLDKYLRPLKVDDKNSALETAESGVGAKVKGDLEVTGQIDTVRTKRVESSEDIVLNASSNIILDAETSSIATGILFKDSGTLIGDVTVHHSGTYLKLYENGGASENDYFTIYCNASGASTIATNDSSGTLASLTLDADGGIALDAGTGAFVAKNAGTQFSVSDSAYAGMIIGYTMIGESGVHATYTLTTSYVVPASTMTVRFIAPPSGVVEIMVQIFVDASSNRAVSFGLSDNATYNSIGNSYQQITAQVDETDHHVHQHYWVVSGLTAGDTYNYWLGATANGGTLAWGGTADGRYCDFIMKATALPSATADFAVYG